MSCHAVRTTVFTLSVNATFADFVVQVINCVIVVAKCERSAYSTYWHRLWWRFVSCYCFRF